MRIKICFSTLLMAVSLTLCNDAYAETWQELRHVPDEYRYFLDSQSLQKQGNRVQFQARYVYELARPIIAPDGSVADEMAREIHSQFVVSCEDQTIQTKATRYFDASGQLVKTINQSEGEAMPIYEEMSDAALTYPVVCEQSLSKAKSAYWAGMAYLNQERSPDNDTLALKEFRTAADLGYAPAQYRMGWMLDKFMMGEADSAGAAKWYQKAAEQGYAQAQLALAEMYNYGNGVELNMEEAFKWYLKAAEQDIPEAQVTVAFWYLNGQGVEQRQDLVIPWLERAVGKGSTKAMDHLALIYMDGSVVSQDFTQARHWAIKAAKAQVDDTIGQSMLAENFVLESTLDTKHREFWQWLLTQAESGDIESQYLLGYLGVENSPGDIQHSRIKWLESAAQSGHPEAQIYLGRLYSQGELQANNSESLAHTWFLKAAEQGHPYAQYLVGSQYLMGMGVDADSDQANRWLTRSAEQGYAEAKTALRQLN